jgi:hypothetical protein
MKNELVKKNVFVVTVSSELITIYEFNRDCFYLKVFVFVFVHLKKSAIFAPNTKTGPVRLSVRTHGFHPCKSGSIPLRATIYKHNLKKPRKLFFEAFFIGFGCIVDDVIVRYVCAAFMINFFFK